MKPRMLVPIALLAFLFAPSGGTVAGERPQNSKDGPVVRIGAVAYSPGTVTVFKGLCRYLNNNDLPSDYVLYSNYDALVAALDRGEVDVAWNTPLAHAQYHVRNACESKTLAMRDVDRNVRSVLVARADSGIDSVDDLHGKRLVLGSKGAAEATILPLHFLERQEFDLGQTKLVSLDGQHDDRGNPCSSPRHVLKAVQEGRGDAGIITESLWKRIASDESPRAELRCVWVSPPYSHCVFTAAADLDDRLAQRFTSLMIVMDPDDPTTADVMRLEGTRKWLPGSPDGFHDLVEALQQN